MIIVDEALRRRHEQNTPIRVGMVGAGFMGRGIALQIAKYTRGMRVVAISSRDQSGARRAYSEAGISDPQIANSTSELDAMVESGGHVITTDPYLLCESTAIDAIVEVTGNVEFAANVVLSAIQHRKHVVMMNAELDATLGCILKVYADRAGVVLTNVDGDQPGVIMNLYRFVKGIGVRPVLCGNIKGLHDPYRNPTTQASFAQKWRQSPYMVTSFADGSKISFEQAIVANATGMRVAKRGMFGPTVETGRPIQEATEIYDIEALLEADGIVDYVVGAAPSPGVFVLGTIDEPHQQHYLNLYKLGTGPLYCFYTPYHLCHFEVPNTIARAVLFRDATIAPIGPPRVEVVATAKTDLPVGKELDGIGGYTAYGLCENSPTATCEGLLPLGLADGCRVVRPLKKDTVIRYDDVELPQGRRGDVLRAEQDTYFANALTASSNTASAVVAGV